MSSSTEICDVAAHGAGRLVAVAKEDGSVAIYDIGGNPTSEGRSDSTATPFGELLDMLLPDSSQVAPGVPPPAILRVLWADFRIPGSIVVTGAADGAIAVWKDIKGDKKWIKVYAPGQKVPSPIVSLTWANLDCGVTAFAAACASGPLLVFTAAKDDEWIVSQIEGHQAVGECNGVSFCPSLPPSSLANALPLQPQGGAKDGRGGVPVGGGPLGGPMYPRLVSCGSEKGIRIWRYAAQDRQWLQERELHTEAGTNTAGSVAPNATSAKLLDVAWAPNYGLPFTYIAASGEDGSVTIFFQDGFDGKWQNCTLPVVFPSPAVRLGWSLVGTYLSVSCTDGNVSVWREQKTGSWIRAADVPTGAETKFSAAQQQQQPGASSPSDNLGNGSASPNQQQQYHSQPADSSFNSGYSTSNMNNGGNHQQQYGSQPQGAYPPQGSGYPQPGGGTGHAAFS